jgi:8-oxo-dGTP pyrophosphatase MutT (NUDIX family)
VTSTIIATAWVCVRDRRVLVVRPHYTDAFYLPGGKPEPGETYAEAAAREVREEVGLLLNPADLAPYTEIVAPAHNRPAGTTVRLICFTGGDDEARPSAAAEIGEIAWFTPADSARCAPAIQQLIAHLANDGLI